MTSPEPDRRPRRWWKLAATAAVLLVGVVLVLPWLVGSPVGRARVAASLNRGLAPGRLEFRSLSVSWFGPTRLGDVVLMDPKGARVGSAPVATLNRTLGQWIVGASGTLTIDLDGAALAVERSAGGSVNLAEALRTLIASPDPKRDLLVKITGGSLQYRDPYLAVPATADALDLNLRIRPSPDPVSWKLRLARGDDASLEVHGDLDRWLARGGSPRTPELQVSVVGSRWPFAAKMAGVDASGKLDGSLDFLRRRGQWRLSGDARLFGLHAGGSPLQGDTLTFDRLDAGWDLAEGDGGWTIRRLGVTSPLGDLKAEGHLPDRDGPGKQRIEGRVDLAALARQLPRTLHLRDDLTVERGTARLTIDAKGEPGQTSYDVEALVADLAGRDRDRALSLRDPATLRARLIRRGEESTLEELAVKTAFLDASARGKLVDGVEIAGTLDLAGLRKQLGDWVDLGKLELAGKADVAGTYRLRPAGSPMTHEEISGPNSPRNSGRGVGLSDARYANRFKATLTDLRVGGTGAGTIRLERAKIDAATDGPAGSSGLPHGWDSLVAAFDLGRSSGHLMLNVQGGPIDVMAIGATTVELPSSSRLILTRIGGRLAKDRRSLRIGSLAFGTQAATVPPDYNRLASFARGQFDVTTGELSLEATADASASPIALDPDGLRISGIGKGMEALRVDGGFTGDLGALDDLLSGLAGRSPMGASGRWSGQATARGASDGIHLAGKIGLDENPGTAGPPARPTSVAARAHYSGGGERLDLSEFTVSTAFGTLDASGTVEDPSGVRRVVLKGVVAPDFPAINALLVRKVEPGARVEGKPRAFRASGTLGDSPDSLFRRLDADLGFDIAGADIYGMKFGPSPVVLHAKGGRLSFDPISTTLNEGHIRLEPEVDLDAPGGPVLRLAKNSAIREARINDEVSKRVLAYVAPILDQATRARGLVSVDLDHAEFPIGLGRGRQAKLEGAVVFEDVEFAPGPLANDLLTVIGRRDASLRLDRPVTLTIADGRVNQRGMSIPVGDLTRIEMAGWVDFDRNLAVTATLPVTAQMLGNNPLLTDIAAGTQVRLPITGTLDRPVIDREALTANLQEMGKSLLTRGATRGAMELLMRMARPRDPNAPPPPPRLTPQERRTQRQEKKAIRRGEVPPPPVGDPGR